MTAVDHLRAAREALLAASAAIRAEVTRNAAAAPSDPTAVRLFGVKPEIDAMAVRLLLWVR